MKTLVFATLFVVQCASATITLDCTYLMHNWAKPLGTMYTCEPRVIQTGGTRNVDGVSQNHLAGRSNRVVIGLHIRNQQIDSIPQDVNLYFPNLEGIHIHGCPIKSVTMADLEPFPKLRSFGVVGGQLTTIHGDLLRHLPELQLLYFNTNKITSVGPGLFQYSPKLQLASFPSNLCINSQATDKAAFINFGRELAFRCPPTVKMIQEIILGGDEFREALNDQIHLIISAIGNRMELLEDENKALLHNQTMIVGRMHHLERVNMNLCAVFPAFCMYV